MNIQTKAYQQAKSSGAVKRLLGHLSSDQLSELINLMSTQELDDFLMILEEESSLKAGIRSRYARRHQELDSQKHA